MTTELTRPVLVYVPAYQCEAFVVATLQELPSELWEFSEVLVVDNCSTDGTVEAVLRANDEGRFPRPVHVVRTPRNVGYAGSQKAAYKLALENPAVEWVVMLHGDGQYAPHLVGDLVRQTKTGAKLVYGHRDRSAHDDRDETPLITYSVIRAMSAVESLVTGFSRREWHSGFVMYHRSFLEQVDLDALTDTFHIDGHLLFAAGVLGATTVPMPIYKRYEGYEAFGGVRRIRYVANVLGLLAKFRLTSNDLARRGPLRPHELEWVTQHPSSPDPDQARAALARFVAGPEGRVVDELQSVLERHGLYTGELLDDLKVLDEKLGG